jgi:hypothetical protein
MAIPPDLAPFAYDDEHVATVTSEEQRRVEAEVSKWLWLGCYAPGTGTLPLVSSCSRGAGSMPSSHRVAAEPIHTALAWRRAG